MATVRELARVDVVPPNFGSSDSVRRCLLAYHDTPSFFGVAKRLVVHHQTVQRCIERAESDGPVAELDDRPRPGKEPVITPEAKAWPASLACDKDKEHGYPQELWTTRLLARHAREHGAGAGHPCLARLVQGTESKLLSHKQIKPHKIRCCLERRDVEFEQKMAEVACVYRQAQVLKKAAAGLEKSTNQVCDHLLRREAWNPRRSRRRHRICRPYPASVRALRAILNISVMARSAYWLELTC